MPFLKENEPTISSFNLRLDKIHYNINFNDKVILNDKAFSPGKRPLPIGIKSPFMFIASDPSEYDIDSFYDDPDRKKSVNTILNYLNLDSKNAYLTYAIKYPTQELGLFFKDGKEHMKQFFFEELIVVKPEIIFVLDDWTKKLFEKVFHIEIKGIGKQTLTFTYKGKELSYTCMVAPHKKLQDLDELKPLITKLKVDWKFVHLHCHNSFSLKDGIGTPATRIQYAIDHNKPAVATTNHGSIADWISIYNDCKKNNIKPILGVEAYFNRDAEELRKAIGSKEKEDVQIRKRIKKNNNHVTMLVKNYKGYENLIKIQNDAWINGFYFNPITSPETIKNNSEGIVVLSGCSSGEQNKIITQKYYLTSDDRQADVENLIENKVKGMKALFRTKNDTKASEDEYLDVGDLTYFYERVENKFDEEEYRAFALKLINDHDKQLIDEADAKIRNIIKWWKAIFKENYYLELMLLDWEPQKIINNELIKLSKELDVPIIITNDAHYINASDFKVQELQMLSDQKKTFQDLENDTESKIWTIKADELYYKTVEELHTTFIESHKNDIFTEDLFWKAIENVIKVVDRIEHYDLDTSSKLPKLFDDPIKMFAKKVALGVKRRFPKGMTKEYQDRMAFEFKIIVDKGFADYFLIIEDIITWAKDKYGPYAVGPGRGSAAGSLISYLLGITDIDPIPHKLLFERFLDISRADVVDIDTDFAQRIKDDVYNYIVERFGKDYVAPIGTFGILKTRSAILDVARTFGIEPSETFAITRQFANDLDEKLPLEKIEEIYPDLKVYFDKYEEQGINLRYYVEGIKGGARNQSQHACGVLITSEKLNESIALSRASKNIVTAWQEGAQGAEISSLGFYKFDILGLLNLQVIGDTIKMIKERHGVDINLNDIDLNEKFVYDNVVKNQDNYGIFQFEKAWVGKIIDLIGPDNFEELAAISALIRPGALNMKAHEKFADRKHGRAIEGKDYDSPEILRDILGPTQNVLIYQEQMMQIANKIGGFTKAETNQFRKQIVKLGKFKQDDPEYKEIMVKYHDKFVANASKPEYLGDKLKAEELWESIKSQASYSFNKSHSVSYTVLSFREYWLKAHYDAEFNISLLNNTELAKKDKSDITMIASYMTEMMKKGIVIKQPDINTSVEKFSLSEDGKEIRWGLGWIKKLPSKDINKLLEDREANGPYKDIDDLYKRVKIGKSAIDTLTFSGAFDCLIENDTLSNDRFELHEYIMVNLRKDKKYKSETWTEKKMIDKELEYLTVSLTELKTFVKIRTQVEKELDMQANPLHEVSDVGEYYVVAKVAGLEKRKTKTKKDYVRISLRDETKLLRSIYVWPWETKGWEAIQIGQILAARIVHEESGFIKLGRFSIIN